MPPGAPPIILRRMPVSDYETVWRAMLDFCATRGGAADEIWLLQHAPVYTLGVAGRAEHLLRENGIPLVRSDRGGQITYHGPGQIVAYLLLDLRRRKMGARALVAKMESAAVALLAEYGIRGAGKKGAPGVYVGGKKIAALGLRIRRGCSYHGMSFNVKMDLSPFADIAPCGFSGLRAAQLADLAAAPPLETVREDLARHLLAALDEA